MQSGYSEMMGLYPPGKGEKLTHAQVEAITNGPARTPFQIRDIDRLNSELGDEALPAGFQAVEIFVFNNNDVQDDVASVGCPYIVTTEDGRVDNDAVFKDYDWMIDGTREPIEEMYGLTDDQIDALNYKGFERLTDTAVALDFEGYPEKETYFSEDEWELNHEF